MKIQSIGSENWKIKNKDFNLWLNPAEGEKIGDEDLVFWPTKKAEKSLNPYQINLPGEYEIKQVLVKCFWLNDRQEFLLYKIVLDGLVIAWCTELSAEIEADVLSKLGENIDVLVCTNKETKISKKIIDIISPRLVVLSGDEVAQQQAVNELNGTRQNGEYKISRGNLSDEKTDIVVLGG